MTSLFTNIPLSETIKLALDPVNTSQSNLNISEKNLASLFNFAICESHFLFKGKFYGQIYGVAMGSLLASVLPNLFMGHYEKLWLSNYDRASLLYTISRFIFFRFPIRMMRQNGFSLILIQDTLMLDLLWKQRSTKLFPFWMYLLIIVTTF